MVPQVNAAVSLSPPKAAPPPELDDITLVRAQRGDARAQSALVVRYQRPVFAILSRMLHGHGRDLVEDVAQDTFLRVFKALPTFQRGGPARLSTWILTIASNRAIDELRRRRRPQVPLSEARADEATGGDAAADAIAERKMLARVLEQAIADLSPEHRAAFMLREYHELAYEEIAEHLQIDLGTVKSRLSRARAALRRALAEVYHA